MGQTSTRVPESSLLPGLNPKMCPLQSLLPTGNRFESLGMVPISSPMAGLGGGEGVKRYSIVSFPGEASSHGKDARLLFFLHRPLISCSGSVGRGSCQSHIFFPHEMVDSVFLGSSS